MQLRTVCDKRLEVPITSQGVEAKISIDIEQTWYFFVTFYYFLIRHFKKKRKKSCFLKSEKNVKYVLSNTGPGPGFWLQVVFRNKNTKKHAFLLENSPHLAASWPEASGPSTHCCFGRLALWYLPGEILMIENCRELAGDLTYVRQQLLWQKHIAIISSLLTLTAGWTIPKQSNSDQLRRQEAEVGRQSWGRWEQSPSWV